MTWRAILLTLLLSGCASCFDGDPKMKFAAGALMVSSMVDASTSVAAFDRGERELNPIARPFTSSTGGTFAFAAVTSVALTAGACWLKSKGAERYKYPLWIGTAAHTAASISNVIK